MLLVIFIKHAKLKHLSDVKNYTLAYFSAWPTSQKKKIQRHKSATLCDRVLFEFSKIHL